MCKHEVKYCVKYFWNGLGTKHICSAYIIIPGLLICWVLRFHVVKYRSDYSIESNWKIMIVISVSCDNFLALNYFELLFQLDLTNFNVLFQKTIYVTLTTTRLMNLTLNHQRTRCGLIQKKGLLELIYNFNLRKNWEE